MSKRNLFIGHSWSAVNSPVISMEVDSCDSKKRRRRSAVGLAPGATTAVDINMDEPSPGIAVNATPPSDDGVVMSVFNLTEPGKLPVLIVISPADPAEVNVFIRLNSTPTAADYDWFLTSNNGTNNYSLYIPAEETRYVDQLFVGVQPFHGNVRRFNCVQEALLPQTDRATRCVSRNLANC